MFCRYVWYSTLLEKPDDGAISFLSLFLVWQTVFPASSGYLSLTRDLEFHLFFLEWIFAVCVCIPAEFKSRNTISYIEKAVQGRICHDKKSWNPIETDIVHINGSRPTISQLWSSKIRCMTFMNYIKFTGFWSWGSKIGGQAIPLELKNKLSISWSKMGFVYKNIWFFWEYNSSTGPFTILELQDQEIGEFRVVQVCWATDFRQLWIKVIKHAQPM